jgi:hypothetical protein
LHENVLRRVCEDRVKPVKVLSKDYFFLKETDGIQISSKGRITDLKPVKVFSKDYVLLKKADGTWTYRA